jgi:protein-disulfide isomerase
MNSMHTNNPWFAVSMGLIGLIVGYGFATGMGTLPGVPAAPGGVQADTTGQPTVTADPADVDDDTVLGNEDAPITLIEFTDYQCPFCSRHYEQTYKQIKADYIDTGKVKLVVRDYPLSFHPNAQKASEASECADEQDKFYEMHDVLFSKQGEWSELAAPAAAEKFKQYARDLGLKAAAFDSCLDDGAMAAEVNSDLSEGQAAGIDGTPGFWILGPNGETKNISGAYPYDTFKTEFDNMLN